MSPIPKNEVALELAKRLGLDASTVTNILHALSDFAAENVESGVLIHGFGELRAARGMPQTFFDPRAGVNVQAPGQVKICFTPDSNCLEKFSNSLATAEIGDRMPQNA